MYEDLFGILIVYWEYFLFFYFLRTVLALSGEDFAIIASDTRLSEGFMIHSRESPKTYTL